ncbi:MAG TPA: hypothetical protein VK699_08275 [Terriglobales bacterium]|jgi:hypothetical protein|nr:hypothetical protein [Terriglobales bacterium]
MEATLKNLRIIQMALIGSLGLLVYLIERIHTAPAILKPAVLMVFIALAIYLTFSIISFRTRFLSRAEEKLRLQPTDAAALKKWRVLHIAIFGMCESLGLYGIVLREMGASFSQAAGFYAGAIVLMLLSTPRRP